MNSLVWVFDRRLEANYLTLLKYLINGIVDSPVLISQINILNHILHVSHITPTNYARLGINF